MKLVCISDLHGHQITPPLGDLLVIAGDLTGSGKASQIEEMGYWLAGQVDRYPLGVVGCFGNHDWLAERDPARALQLINPSGNERIRFLQQETCEIGGLKFYGAADTPEFCNWAFNRTSDELQDIWSKIPLVDVVITHGPPYGILDLVPRGELVGCPHLLAELTTRVRPKLHVCGHIHLNGGQQKTIDGITFCNASVCTESYTPINNPCVVSL